MKKYEVVWLDFLHVHVCVMCIFANQISKNLINSNVHINFLFELSTPNKVLVYIIDTRSTLKRTRQRIKIIIDPKNGPAKTILGRSADDGLACSIHKRLEAHSILILLKETVL